MADNLVKVITTQGGFEREIAENLNRRRYDGQDDTESNLMADIDESTPVSEQTRVVYSGWHKIEQTNSKDEHYKNP